MQRGEPLPVQPFLHAGNALVVDIHQPDHLRDRRTVRIDALVLGQEADAGNAETVNLALLLGRNLALEPDEAAIRRQSLAQFLGVEIGQCGGELLLGVVDVDELARLGIERGRLDVGGEDGAVAVENVGPRGGDRVLADGVAVAVLVALDGEGDEAQRDHAVDAGEGEDGEAEPRLGLHLAVDVAAVEQRSAACAASGSRGLSWRAPWRHRLRRRAPARCRWWRAPAGAIMAPIGSLPGGGDGRARRQIVETVELVRLDRLQFQETVGQFLDARGRVELGPLRAQHRDGVALVAQFVAQLGDARGLQRGIELDLVDRGRRQHERADDQDVDQAHHGQRPRIDIGERGQPRQQIATDRRHARAPRCARRRAAWRSGRADCAATSASSAVIGRRVSTRKLGAGTLDFGRVARAAARRRALGEKSLDDAVLERMEGDRDQPPAGFQDALGTGKRRRQFAELVIDENAQRLERARGRMDVAGLAHARRRRQCRRARPSWRSARLLARPHDGARHAA